MAARNALSSCLVAWHIHSESEFTEFKTLSVFVGTYNVNGKVPTEDITSWLCDFKKLGAKDVPDIYVVGCVNNSVQQPACERLLTCGCGHPRDMPASKKLST